MSLPSPRPRPRAPKPRKEESAGISLGHPIRALLIFVILTWALLGLVERLGMTNSIQRMGVAVVASLVLTPVTILLINRWWKSGTEQI